MGTSSHLLRNDRSKAFKPPTTKQNKKNPKKTLEFIVRKKAKITVCFQKIKQLTSNPTDTYTSKPL